MCVADGSRGCSGFTYPVRVLRVLMHLLCLLQENSGCVVFPHPFLAAVARFVATGSKFLEHLVSIRHMRNAHWCWQSLWHGYPMLHL